MAKPLVRMLKRRVLIPRAPWPAGFPDVVIHTTVADRDRHPDYHAAKAGDLDAAARVVGALLCERAVAEIACLLAGISPIVVPVHAQEREGINFLPQALAIELGHRLGLELTGEIVQTNTVGHTRADGFHRLAFQPTFDGAVKLGRPHLLVDDHVGLGGTLANLLQALRKKHGEPLEHYWCEQFGFGLEALTEAEAGYLLRTPSFDVIRDRMAEAARQGLSGQV
jgi:hypothetical protein